MKNKMVYWHHFNETEEMAREVEAAFPNVVFGVAPSILKEQLDDQLEKFIRYTSPERLMAESDAPMVGERRATNHEWSEGAVLKRVATIKGVPRAIMLIIMLMFVQLHLIGSQAIIGGPPSTISTIQAVVESWQAGKILNAF